MEDSITEWTPLNRELVEVAPQDVLRMIAEQKIVSFKQILTRISEGTPAEDALLDAIKEQQEELEAWS